jgi:large subunit ribosomal protein L11
MEQIVEVVVEGGKATAAPPIGPSLAPTGVNIGQVVDAINDKTRELQGLKVPVKVIVDTATKEFRIEVGKPPASALILKELNLERGSALAGKDRVGDFTPERVKKIARAKFGSDEEANVKQIEGTCRSMGVTIGEGAVTQEEIRKAEEDKMHVMEEEEVKEKAAEEGAEEAAAPAATGAEEEKEAGAEKEGAAPAEEAGRPAGKKGEKEEK